MPVLPDAAEGDVTTALVERVPGAVLVTVCLDDDGLDDTVPGFFAAAVWRSRIADVVLVMLPLPADGLEVTVEPEPVVCLLIGRLLTELPPLRDVLVANTLSDPVL